jgi:hypothetical protein
MMRTWSFYDLTTGLFLDRRYRSTTDDHVALNTPPGARAIEGEFDHLSQRVQIGGDIAEEDGTVRPNLVDYQPPQPSPDHEWNPDTRRWQLSPATATRQQQVISVRMLIRDTELSQHRAARELLLQIAEQLGISGAAVDRLKAADAAISSTRPLLK